jgi:cyclopropane-fatty-acyl-phospholipid synthase
MKAYPPLSRRPPEDKVIETFDRLFSGAAFEVQLPGRPSRRFGQGEPAFQILVRNQAGVAALGSLNENRIGEAYLNGDIDLGGDVVAALDLRTELKNQRRLAHLFTSYGLGYLWATYVQPRVFGQVKCDERWISQHYDLESDFYLLFLDKQARCYSHGYFASDDEPLEAAIQRKLDTAITACGIQPGWRVLDIGAGWGAFTAHAGRRGIQVTSLTISAESERYVRDLIAREQLPCRVLREHFLEHTTGEPYDAIVNLGVTEHLPDYAATLAQYRRLLRPGGRVFLDACASRRKYPFSAFVRTHIWPGNTTPMHLASYLKEVGESPFEVLYLKNDRHSYLLTTRHWAQNLDRARDEVVSRWGEYVYRRFRIYLWGCVHYFTSGTVTAYRLLLQLPAQPSSHPSQAYQSTRQPSVTAGRPDPVGAGPVLE